MAESNSNRDILVFSEKAPLLYELLAGARSMAQNTGGRVTALALGPRETAQAALARGADSVLWLGEPKEGYLIDDYVPTIAGLVEQGRPYALLIGATRRGRAAAGRLAARFDVTALTDVLAFEQVDGALQASHMIFGGGALRVDRPLAYPIIATAAAGVFAALPEQPAEGEIREVPFVEPERRARLRERKQRPRAAVDLTAARRVVCSGRGVARREDLAMVAELAAALGAELTCTRPLAEGLDWLPRERYIGISGATVKPDLYLGVGVSGQAQHAIGMHGSRVVVAINKDAGAPIASQADYIITDDLYQVVPALIAALKARR